MASVTDHEIDIPAVTQVTAPATAAPVTSAAGTEFGVLPMASASPSSIDPSMLNLALSLFSGEAGACAARRNAAADQLASDSQRMWAIAMTTPTVSAALGYRTADESGSGRTRAETNNPAATSAAGNATSGGVT